MEVYMHSHSICSQTCSYTYKYRLQRFSVSGCRPDWLPFMVKFELIRIRQYRCWFRSQLLIFWLGLIQCWWTKVAHLNSYDVAFFFNKFFIVIVKSWLNQVNTKHSWNCYEVVLGFHGITISMVQPFFFGTISLTYFVLLLIIN